MWLQLRQVIFPSMICVSTSKVCNSFKIAWSSSMIAFKFSGLVGGSSSLPKSLATFKMASQSNLSNMWTMNSGLNSCSSCTSWHSENCSGKASTDESHVLMAHLTKLEVKNFILTKMGLRWKTIYSECSSLVFHPDILQITIYMRCLWSNRSRTKSKKRRRYFFFSVVMFLVCSIMPSQKRSSLLAQICMFFLLCA